jgi:GAF domain-containing protein/HAMP domain-containing protein
MSTAQSEAPALVLNSEPTSDSRINRLGVVINLNTFFTGIAFAAIASAAIMLQREWQIEAAAGIFLLDLLLTQLARLAYQHRRTNVAALMLLSGNMAAFLAQVFLFTGIGVSMAAMILILTIIVSVVTLDWLPSNYAIGAAIPVAITALLLEGVGFPFRLTLPGLDTYLPILPGFFLLVLAILSFVRFSASTLQVKILTAFMVIVIIPVAIIALMNIESMSATIREQAVRSLTIGANESAAGIDEFIQQNSARMVEEASLPAYIDYLSMSPVERQDSPQEHLVLAEISALQVKQRPYIDSYAILDANGRVLLDTYYYPYRAFADEGGTECFQNAVSTDKTFVTPVEFASAANLPAITFCNPIRNDQGRLVGVLRARFYAYSLLQALQGYVNIVGPQSYPILFDENLIRLADPVNPTLMFQSLVPLNADRVRQLQKAKRLPQNLPDVISTNEADFAQKLGQIDQSPTFDVVMHTDQAHTRVVAVTRLKSEPWILAFVQDESVIMAPANAERQTTTNIAGIIVAVIAGLSLLSARIITRPISNLTDTARKITTGDLDARAAVRTGDEIGTLGNAFNVMAAQLRAMIGNLEQRVAERTRELEIQSDHMHYRATQLQTVAEVARAVTSVQDLESLLTTVAQMVSERFGFYHVGIFLLDDSREKAVLRAANSPGGQRMLARGHNLKVGEVGIVGYVTDTGNPRIATDVGQDAVFFNNPDLPETRSEMALPLRIGPQVIGALDVQSTESAAFSEEDVALFTTLADQIAVAIDNNRLYGEMRLALKEAQELHRSYLRQEWQRELTEEEHPSYRYTQHGVAPAQAIDLPEVQRALSSGEVAVYNPTDIPEPHNASRENARSAMAVPIKLRGQTIGVVDLQETSSGREWSDAEVNMVQGIADQIGLALENARLFRQTIRRADRERKVLEITSRIRAVNDPRQMLEIAVQELQRALRASRAQIVLQSPAEIEDVDPGSRGNGNTPA